MRIIETLRRASPRARRAAALLGGTILALAGMQGALAEPVKTPPGLDKINHILVIYLENRSFDSLYGHFPGANGVDQAGAAATQLDKDGKPYATLPAAIYNNVKPAINDPRIPADLPNGPYAMDKFIGPEQVSGDLIHRYYHEQLQIDDGKMDKFVAYTDAGGLVMSNLTGEKLPLWDYAKSYVLADNFFHAAFGGSFLNHFWLVCACSPKYDGAPEHLVAKVDDKGVMVRDGAVTPDGYAVNTMQSQYMPHSLKIDNKSLLLPPQDAPTIGDRLSEKNISWAWYSGGWNDAVAGKPDPLFQFHHQPLAYFKSFGDDTPGRKAHLKDYLDLQADIVKGTLPAVAFYKPIGENNEHPGYTNVSTGERHVADLLQALQASPNWKDSLVIITYDENGGLWDHVAPPKRDKWGPGSRVPTLIISPFAKKGYIDHTQYDTTAILKLIEARYNLEPLATADAAANDLSGALDLK